MKASKMDTTTTILILLSALAQQVLAAPKVPDPFELSRDGYFVLTGIQTTTIPHQQPRTIKFENYFSMDNGNSFTIYTDDTGYGYTILSDSWRDKTYIIRNSSNNISTEIDCELDHVNHHKHIYPWIYEYSLSGYAERALIHGPGAIWLNAIKNRVTYYNQYPKIGIWSFKTNDSVVHLGFEKESKLPAWFEVMRFDTIEHAPAGGTVYYSRTDRLTIEEFSQMALDESKEQRNTLLRLHRQLYACRISTNGHRIFPSLLKRLTRSSQKSFQIQYTIFDANRDTLEGYQRDIRRSKFVTELFSFKKAAQLTQYYQPDTEQSSTSYRTDTFLKFFIDGEPDSATKSALVIGHTSLTTYYHIIANDRYIESCRKGERESFPKPEILIRPVHFTRLISINGTDTEFCLTGHLDGLIALLLNAEHIHYKEFNLRTPQVKDRSTIYHADEWIVHDRNSSLDIHFYFKLSDAIRDRANSPDIDHLIRVDIRDPRMAFQATGAIDDDYNLLMRFDILRMYDDFFESDLYDCFRVPEMCVSVEETDSSEEDSSDDDDDLIYDSNESEHNEDFERGDGTISESDMNLPTLIDNYRTYEIVSTIMLKHSESTTADPHKRIFLREIVDLDQSAATISVYLSEDLLANSVAYVTYLFRYTSDALFTIRHQQTGESCQLVDDVDEPWLRLLSSDDYKYYIHLPASIQGSSALIQSDRLKMYGVGALWDRASSSQVTTTFGGIDSEQTIKSGEYEYNPAYFNLDELDLSMKFDFLYNRTKYLEDKSTGKHHTMIEMLHLAKIHISGKLYRTNFEPVDIQILRMNTNLQSRQTTLPEACRSSIARADQAVESRYGHLLTMPRFEDFVGDGCAYYAKYDLNSDEHTSETITELFDRNNRGWIKVEGAKDNQKQIFIEWNNKLVFDYNETTGECIANRIDEQSAPLRLGYENDSKSNRTCSNHSESLHSLASIWIKVSQRPMRLRSTPFTDRMGRRLISYTYVCPVTHEGELVEVEFVGRRYLASEQKSQLVLRSIRSTRVHLTHRPNTGVDVIEFDSNVESYNLPQLPESCAKFMPNKDTTTPTPMAVTHNTIPNPFKFDSNRFYLLKGNHTIRLPHRQEDVSFENYFSLASSISYTIFTSSDPDDLGYAILTDTAVSGQIYVIRNPRERAGATTDCELDHKYNHRHVFPWQYEYNLTSTARRASIFGPGAIWLNFIDSNIDTNKVPYNDTNISSFHVDDLVITLAFAKDTPRWFSLQRINSINHANGFGVQGTEHSYQSDHIRFESFAKDLTRESDPLRRLYRLLNTCIKSNKRHRVFPSLLKQLMASRQKSYKIRYRKLMFPPHKNAQLDQYDATQHKSIGEGETVTELFSLTKEAQSTQYDYYNSTILGHKSDTFLKLFTSKEMTNDSSSSSSTTYYHISRTDGIIDECLIGAREPRPKQRIFTRPIHFHRYKRDNSSRPISIRMTGHLTGLVALLLNAAEVHYKEFRLQTRLMRTVADGTTFYADEWIVHDNSSWNIHFYFKQLSSEEKRRKGMEMTVDRLVLIDIRDARTVSPENQGASDGNLSMRFHIRAHKWEFDQFRGFSELDSYFKVPDVCNNVHTDENDQSDEEDDDHYEDADDDFSDQEDDDSEADEEEDTLIDKNEHRKKGDEDFELGFGAISEYNEDLPSFDDYLDDYQAYEIVSKVTIERSNSEPDLNEKIFLKEKVSRTQYTATLSIYLSKDSLTKDKPHVTYFFRYRSDALFIIKQDTEDNCRLIDDVEEPWLVLLSTDGYEYYIDLPENVQRLNAQSRFALIRSTRLRLYGVGALWSYASSSGAAENVISYGKASRWMVLSDGCEYHPINWSLKETGSVMNFRFLYNQTRHREAKSSRRHYRKEEMLHLDRLHIVAQAQPDTIDIEILKFRTDFEDESMAESCRVQMGEADRALENRIKHLLTMPRFEDFVGEGRAYYASYEHSTSFDDSSKKRVIEIFSIHQGWIKLEGERQYFIDRKNNSILDYNDSTEECRSIALNEMSLELVPSFKCDIDNFNPTKPFGLAALWVRLAKEPMILHTQPDSEGKSSISYLTTMTNDAGKLEIEVNFSEKRKPIEPSDLPELVLKSIRVKQSQSSFDAEERQLDINVETIYKDLEPIDLPDLPESCAQLIDRRNAPTPAPADGPTPVPTDRPTSTSSPMENVDRAKYAREHFPQLSHHLKDKFLMQSEVAIRSELRERQPTAVTYQLYEWYDHTGGVRLKSRDFKGTNMDLLIHPETNEYFDLSTRYKCANNRIPVLKGVSEDGTESKDISECKLARFWAKDWTVVDHPSDLYYGAMGLWRLAEKNLDHVELIDVAGKDVTPSSDGRIRQDIEVWRVSIPGYSWSYQLYIAKYSIGNMTRVALEGIIVTEGSRMISIDVVNYRYDDQLSDLTEHFSLPVGHGCVRSDIAIKQMSRGEDVFPLDIDQGFVLSYEATLEIVGESTDENTYSSPANQLLPTLSGELINVGRIGTRKFDVSAQTAHTNYGATSGASRTIVTSGSNKIRYEIDQVSGACNSEPFDSGNHDDIYFVLEFPADDQHRLYTINVPIRTKEDKKFWYNEINRPITKPLVSGDNYSIYEQYIDYLELTKVLRGRAAVIRTFFHDGHVTSVNIGGRAIRKHDKMQTKVMLFDRDGTKLRAVLMMSLYLQPRATTSGLLQSLSINDCFNGDRTLSSYKISYERPDADQNFADPFYERLISLLSIDLDQLDGKAQVEFNDVEDTLDIHFNVWEPILEQHYATVQESTMVDELGHSAILMPTTDVENCFDSCRYVRCLAVSYCKEDHNCQVVPEFNEPGRNGTEIIGKITLSRSKQDCVYHYRRDPENQLVTLGSFYQKIFGYVHLDRSKDHLQALSIEVSGHDYIIQPTKFVDITGGSDSSDAMILESFVSSMMLWEANDYKIDLRKLNQLNEEKGTQFLAHSSETTYCVAECEKIDCVYLSYCAKDNICTMITNGSDIHLLRTGVKVEAQQSDGCTVAARDSSLTYDHHYNTIAPTVCAKRLNDYTEAECASVCDSDGDKCLSFDFCRQFVSPVINEGICLLQSDHLAINNIERDWLGPSSRVNSNRIDGKDVYCSHYSKSLLSEFKRLPGRKFKADKGNHKTIRGPGARKCAAICLQDECEAFEHCQDVDKKLSGKRKQSCRFVSAANETTDIIEINPLSERVCSIYSRTEISMDESLKRTLHSNSLIGTQVHAEHHGYWIYAIYLFVGVVVGSIVQIVHVRIKGKSFLFQ